MNIQPTATATASVAKTDERAVNTAAAGAAKSTSGATGKSADKEPSADEVNAAVKSLNDNLANASQDIEFSVDQDSKKTVVKLVDRTTHEVLRQMPTKEALEIAKSLDKAMGKLIDSQA